VERCHHYLLRLDGWVVAGLHPEQKYCTSSTFRDRKQQYNENVSDPLPVNYHKSANDYAGSRPNRDQKRLLNAFFNVCPTPSTTGRGMHIQGLGATSILTLSPPMYTIMTLIILMKAIDFL